MLTLHGDAGNEMMKTFCPIYCLILKKYKHPKCRAIFHAKIATTRKDTANINNIGSLLILLLGIFRNERVSITKNSRLLRV